MVIALRKELGHFTALLTLKLVMQHLAKDRSEYDTLVESVLAAFRDRCKKHMAEELAELEDDGGLAYEDALNQVCSEMRIGLAYSEGYR